MSADNNPIVQINLTSELAQLMEFIAYMMISIGKYSAYNRSDQRIEDAPNDLMWIADAMHNVMRIGIDIRRGDPAILAATCDELLIELDKYEHEPHFFKRSLETGTDANPGKVKVTNYAAAKQVFLDIKVKVLPLVSAK